MQERLADAIEKADNGDWDGAHRIVQNMEHPLAYWLHANLHREEGDLSNAQYWYTRASRSFATGDLLEERRQILTEARSADAEGS